MTKAKKAAAIKYLRILQTKGTLEDEDIFL